MVISNIIGGLGNQMFQYATARALALRLDADFRVDLSHFVGYELHQGFELERLFNCPVEKASKCDLSNVLSWQGSKLIQKFLRRPQLKILRKKSFTVEPHHHYWAEIMELEGNQYLYGYWQSEKYFINVAETIRKDFSFKQPLLDENTHIVEQLANVNSVSLHVRRGDYVTNTKNAFIGTCSTTYYQSAIKEIENQIINPVFFIFSDDIDWVKKNLVVDRSSIFVSHNKGSESYNDMRLMSLCKHNIIANSSFSWWGAWLNSNPQKIVIAPKQWFASGQDDSDLIPKTWIRV